MNDAQLVGKSEEAARRLNIYASALPSLEKTGTGRLVRKFLSKIAAEFESFDKDVERAHARRKKEGSNGSLKK